MGLRWPGGVRRRTVALEGVAQIVARNVVTLVPVALWLKTKGSTVSVSPELTGVSRSCPADPTIGAYGG
jgi:hypothetical protein